MSSKLPPVPDFAAIDATSGATVAQRKEVMALVGNLAFAWSNNESVFIYVLMVLLGSDFNTSAVTFISLNTTRARLDLVRRLAKLKIEDQAVVRRLERLIDRFNECTKVRNEFNHCIYQVDPSGLITHTNVLRIVESKTGLRYVQVRAVDAARCREIANTIRRLVKLNRDIWSFLPELERHVRSDRKAPAVAVGAGGKSGA